MNKGIVTVDAYMDTIENLDFRREIDRLRAIIRQELPEAIEVISYGMPMFKFHGMVVGLACFKQHCSSFPGHTVAEFSNDLKGFKTSAGTIQFTPDHPIPDELVKSIVQSRVKQNLEIARSKGKI